MLLSPHSNTSPDNSSTMSSIPDEDGFVHVSHSDAASETNSGFELVHPDTPTDSAARHGVDGNDEFDTVTVFPDDRTSGAASHEDGVSSQQAGRPGERIDGQQGHYDKSVQRKLKAVIDMYVQAKFDPLRYTYNKTDRVLEAEARRRVKAKLDNTTFSTAQLEDTARDTYHEVYRARYREGAVMISDDGTLMIDDEELLVVTSLVSLTDFYKYWEVSGIEHVVVIAVRQTFQTKRVSFYGRLAEYMDELKAEVYEAAKRTINDESDDVPRKALEEKASEAYMKVMRQRCAAFRHFSILDPDTPPVSNAAQSGGNSNDHDHATESKSEFDIAAAEDALARHEDLMEEIQQDPARRNRCRSLSAAISSLGKETSDMNGNLRRLSELTGRIFDSIDRISDVCKEAETRDQVQHEQLIERIARAKATARAKAERVAKSTALLEEEIRRLNARLRASSLAQRNETTSLRRQRDYYESGSRILASALILWAGGTGTLGMLLLIFMVYVLVTPVYRLAFPRVN